MGRLLGVLVVSAVFVPFFAVAGQVDQARRDRLAASTAAPAFHMTCRPIAEDCGER